MSFLLDTDICSAQIRGNRHVYNRFIQHGGRLYVSVVTVAELTIWASRANASPNRARQISELLKDMTVLEVTLDVGRRFGTVQAALMDAATPAPEMDLMIAATALVHNLTLVTHNLQDYVNIPGLTIVDWLGP